MIADEDLSPPEETLRAPASEVVVESYRTNRSMFRIRTALASRVDVQEARDRIDDARRAQTVARWNLLPPVMLDVSYTRRGLGASATPLFGELFNGWRAGVSTSYALDRSDESAAAAVAVVSLQAAEQAAVDAEGAPRRRCAARAAPGPGPQARLTSSGKPSPWRNGSRGSRRFGTTAASPGTSTSSTPRTTCSRPTPD